MVTYRAKQGKLGDRVIRRNSPEIRQSATPTLLTKRKATCVCRYGETATQRRGVEGQPCHTMMLYQLGRARVFHRDCVNSVVCPTTHEGGQKICGQSDGRIVPMKAGNAAGGKPREGRSSRLCHAKSYCRGNIIHAQKWRT